MTGKTLFQSFYQAGFECSTQLLRDGRRLDMVAATRHDQFVEQDYRRLKRVGIRTAREGLRWHLIETSPGCYDFSSVRPMLRAARQHGIQLIWDVFHYGWPEFYDIFSKQWIDAFGDLARQFAKVVREETEDTPFIAPVNEISFTSWAGGDVQYLNPFKTGRGHELKRQLVGAAIRASEVLLTELPDVRLVSPEPVIHIAGDPTRPDDMRHAEEYRVSMFEAWDMLAGRAHPELGGQERYLDVIGANFYERNQWWNFGQTIYRNEPAYRPFREILQEVYARYQRPLFVSETGTENDDRPAWFAYIATEVRAAVDLGVPLQGLCLYPILNHPGWDDERHCFNGLWDYADPAGAREIYKPLADELARQREIERTFYGYPTASCESPRPDLSVAPPLELRIPATPTPDEPIRQESPSILR